jgi:hypothetical protein
MDKSKFFWFAVTDSQQNNNVSPFQFEYAFPFVTTKPTTGINGSSAATGTICSLLARLYDERQQS